MIQSSYMCVNQFLDNQSPFQAIAQNQEIVDLFGQHKKLNIPKLILVTMEDSKMIQELY